MTQIQSKTKKTFYIGLIVVIAIANGWILLSGRNSSPPPSAEVIARLSEQAVIGGMYSGQKGVLPFGEEIDTSIFSDSRYLELIPSLELTVDPEELGVENPFSFETGLVEEGVIASEEISE
ncbi:MAG: hypothetical protein COT91_00545 [Candidatus Doudnabacteria bacterium CG10_big_fil_rev_8_21_14_0_10_41_10]|uniref:Uncharacterized protein n=1 Tax=Candidatus Doudnabacteria bacterium CG10_big_fil_rev_8_21_14_0_10_41_10 TaxID=1974551 RepID=A0A2H0VEU1_9BACT|nr:MAG: hypothetical protein COT91_00545 [Candidatus Doudnabacteria bacterium CG10_big_fil_rev_8_21_14_0_10_41_10]